MPIFEFQCVKCGYIFEEIHIHSDPHKISSFCPVCKEQGFESISKKIISRSSYIMKGFNAQNGYSKK
ncbi:MAG: FmdB family zinc ribbon protein [Candidatus Thorarchaeota archaeon]